MDGVEKVPNCIEAPKGLAIRQSDADSKRMGIWATDKIPKGKVFGPFVGKKTTEHSDSMDPIFVWEIIDMKSGEFLFYIDATDPKDANWMRYINCARFFEEQNMVSEQKGKAVYYTTIKAIMPGEELLTWYETKQTTKEMKKRILKKKGVKGQVEDGTNMLKTEQMELDEKVELKTINNNLQGKKDEESKDSELINGKEESAVQNKDISVKNESLGILDENESPQKYQFELKKSCIVVDGTGKKVYKCEVCAGIYRHAFSLKRHFLRSHINHKYLTEADILNCNIISPFISDVLKVENNEREKSIEENEDISDVNSNKEAQSENDNSSEERRGEEKEEKRRHSRERTSLCSKSLLLAAQLAQNNETGSVDGSSSPEPELEIRTPSPEVEENDNGSIDMEIDGASTTESNPTTERDAPESIKETNKEEENESKEEKSETVSSNEEHSVELLKHLTSHQVDMPGLFRCSVCNELFDILSNLITHHAVHSSASHQSVSIILKPGKEVEKVAGNFPCKQCDKRFSTSKKLRQHERNHRSARLICELCDSSFLHFGELKKHVQRFHADKFFQCGFCVKFFVLKSQLESHVKIHNASLASNQKALDCKNQNFRVDVDADRAESLRVAKYKPGPNRYGCTVCKKRFFDYANMCRHRRLAHQHHLLLKQKQPTYPKMTEKEQEFDYDLAILDMDPTQNYFLNVANNVSDNLNHHIEGKKEHLSKCSKFVKCRQVSMQEPKEVEESVLSFYNFPPGFNTDNMEVIKINDSALLPVLVKTKIQHESGSSKEKELKSLELARQKKYHICNVCRKQYKHFNVYQEHMFNKHSKVIPRNHRPRIRSDLLEELFPKPSKTELFTRPIDLSLKPRQTMVIDLTADTEKVYYQEPPKSPPTLDVCQPVEDSNSSDKSEEDEPSVLSLIPNPVGLLTTCSTQLKFEKCLQEKITKYRCTKCEKSFVKMVNLHNHVLLCARKGIRKEKKLKNAGFHKKHLSFSSKKKPLIKGMKKSAYKIGFETIEMRGKLWYNPHRHVRRRDLTQLLDTLKCSGCGDTFCTISQLERHIKHSCAKRDKIQQATTLKGFRQEVGNKSDLKQPCIYCQKLFTYIGSLKNHITDVCPVRVKKVSLKEKLDDEWESKITNMSKNQATFTDGFEMKTERNYEEPAKKQLISSKHKKGKRKKHGWGNIKKRKTNNGSPVLHDEDVKMYVDEVSEDSMETLENINAEEKVISIKDSESNEESSASDEVDAAQELVNLEPDTVVNGAIGESEADKSIAPAEKVLVKENMNPESLEESEDICEKSKENSEDICEKSKENSETKDSREIESTNIEVKNINTKPVLEGVISESKTADMEEPKESKEVPPREIAKDIHDPALENKTDLDDNVFVENDQTDTKPEAERQIIEEKGEEVVNQANNSESSTESANCQKESLDDLDENCEKDSQSLPEVQHDVENSEEAIQSNHIDASEEKEAAKMPKGRKGKKKETTLKAVLSSSNIAKTETKQLPEAKDLPTENGYKPDRPKRQSVSVKNYQKMNSISNEREKKSPSTKAKSVKAQVVNTKSNEIVSSVKGRTRSKSIPVEHNLRSNQKRKADIEYSKPERKRRKTMKLDL